MSLDASSAELSTDSEGKSSIQQEVAKQEPQAEESPAEEEEEEELSAEEQGRRIASQWTQDPEASGKAKEAVRFLPLHLWTAFLIRQVFQMWLLLSWVTFLLSAATWQEFGRKSG